MDYAGLLAEYDFIVIEVDTVRSDFERAALAAFYIVSYEEPSFFGLVNLCAESSLVATALLPDNFELIYEIDHRYSTFPFL